MVNLFQRRKTDIHLGETMRTTIHIVAENNTIPTPQAILSRATTAWASNRFSQSRQKIVRMYEMYVADEEEHERVKQEASQCLGIEECENVIRG